MSACRECGRQPWPGNPLDNEGFHTAGCTSSWLIPHCLGCDELPWNCWCTDGPWFELGPRSLDAHTLAEARKDGP